MSKSLMCRGRRRLSARARDERGLAVVEFALVVPVLAMIVFGIINFGFLVSEKAALSNAARTSARYGTVNAYSASTHTCQSVIDKARGASKSLGIGDSNKTNVAVTVKFTNNSTGTVSTVCSAAAGATSASSGGANLPCYNVAGTPSTPDTLTVETSFSQSVLVPIPGLGSSMTVTGSSSFICEYYK